MTQPKQPQAKATPWRIWRSRFNRPLRLMALVVVSWVAITITWRSVSLIGAAQQPIDAWFILGGSIQREMYIAEQTAAQRRSGNTHENPSGLSPKLDIPILISTGSKLPCLWAIFNRAGADLDRVWAEECATSTFGNFVYSVPILASWKAHHVKLTTSETHYPRAKWMAQIAFGSRGIWVEFDPAPEIGIPANQESRLKTVLDVTRIIASTIVTPILPRHCDRLTNLARVDWLQWSRREAQGEVQSVSCEYQAQILPQELPPGIALKN